jgi:hypothetical protein
VNTRGGDFFVSLENMIELASCIIALGLLFFGVQKRNIREAVLSFLFMQSFDFLLSVFTVQFKLISYPVRFFSYVCRTNISFEFLIFPAVSVLYNLHYPLNGKRFRKLLYSLIYPTVLTVLEKIIETYTRNIKYLHWNWFLSWISMAVSLYIAYLFFKWFFEKDKQ